MATPDTSDDETSNPAASADPDETAAPAKRSPLEFVGLIGMIAILVGFGIFLFRMLSTDLVDASADDPVEIGKLSLPISGSLASITAVEAGWRPLREEDRTDKTNKILPEVTITAAPSKAGATAYLKVHFLGSDGEIAGDVHTIKVEGDSNNTLHGTRGIVDDTAFVSYRFGAEGRWGVEVLESASYGDDEWVRIAQFTIPDTLEKEKSE